MTGEHAPQVPEKPFVTVTYNEQGQEAIQTNLKPGMRPLILWMLERAKMIIMTQTSNQEKSKIMKPGDGFVQQMRHRMGKG